MFGHVNVKGAMSGALTTGNTLTGGTSGATGTIESLSTATATNITGASKSSPVVITTGAHTFTEGQQVLIASVSGMTKLNSNYYTVKNPLQLVQNSRVADFHSGQTRPSTQKYNIILWNLKSSILLDLNPL